MPSDTFKYVPAGYAGFPGICVICGSNQRDFIDFGVSVEYHGAILICNECILELQHVEELPFVQRKTLEELEAAGKTMQDQLKQMAYMRENLSRGVVHLVSDFAAQFDALGLDPEPVPQSNSGAAEEKRRADTSSGESLGF